MKISKLRLMKQERIVFKMLKNDVGLQTTVLSQLLLAHSGNRHMAMIEMNTMTLLTREKWHNFYIEDECLVDFIESSPIMDVDSGKLLELVDDFAEEHVNGIVLHFANRRNSILFGFGNVMKDATSDSLQHNIESPDIVDNMSAIFYAKYDDMGDNDIGSFSVNAGGVFYDGAEKEMATDEYKSWRQIILNLILYIDAFPEYVIDGVPHNLTMVRGVKRAMSSRVKVAPAIREAVSMGVSPHMRRGHFRFLKSDRFKKKRFQTVYIKPTMIKGKASTVKTV